MTNQSLVVGFVVVALLAGCKQPSHEQITDQFIETIQELTTTLSNIRDEDSARAVVPKLEELLATIDRLRERGRKLGEPTADVKMRIEQKLAMQQEKTVQQLTQFLMTTAADPRIAPIIEPVLERMRQAR